MTASGSMQHGTPAPANPAGLWGTTPPVLVLDRTRDDRSMLLIGTPEHAPVATAMGLWADGKDRWRVHGWHRKRALWPFADPETDALLREALKEHNRPSKPPFGPHLTADKYGFAFICGPSAAPLARNAGFKWNAAQGVWHTDHRYLARHLWALADDFAHAKLSIEFGAEARPPCPLQRPTLFFDEGRFVHTCSFDDKDATKLAGFRWDPTEKIWYTRQVPIALKLHAGAEPRLQEVLARSSGGPPFTALAKLSLLDFVEIVLPDQKDQPGYIPVRDPESLHVLPDGRFYCTDPARAFKAGFKLDDRGRWVSSDVDPVLALRDRADLLAERTIQERLSAKFAAAVADTQRLGIAPIPVPPELTYLPYQLDGIRFAAARNSTLLGDEMGLGKTVQALGLINLTRPHLTLIVCPAMLCPNWLREARRWLTGDVSTSIFRTDAASDALGDMNGTGAKARVMIASYDVLPRLPSQEWDLAVFDEAHYLKNPSTRRTRAALGPDGIKAKRRLLMTGTPIFNRPQDLWPILSSSLPDIFHRPSRFKDLYAVADPRSIPEDKAENLTVLGEILHKTIMLRRLKNDVLSDLPPKTWQTVLMDVGDATAETLANDEWAAKRRFDAAVAKGASFTERRSILAELAELRRRTAEAKLPAALEHVLSVIEQNEPMVIFAYHRAIAQSLASGLAEAGAGAAVLDGSVPPARRQKIVDAFQAGEGDALVATMDSAGVGLTLTRSATIAFLELDWTPAKMRQAEDRLHRHGQKRPVTVQYLVVDGTIDAYIADMVQCKTDMAASTLGDDLIEIDRLLSGPAVGTD